MIWTKEQKAELASLCMAGTSNKDLAAHFSVPVTEIYAKRSQWELTRDKCAAAIQSAAPVVKTKSAEKPGRILEDYTTTQLLEELMYREARRMVAKQ